MDICVILKTNIFRSIKWPRLLWEAINLAKQDAVDNNIYKKRFIFYKNEYVGLLKDHDDTKNQQLLEKFSWYNKLYDYVKYSTLNGKMPSSNSKNKNEKAMYYFLYRSKKYYKNGILPKNKEILLRTFGVDLDN